VRSSRIQVCPAIGGRHFIDFSERDRADEHAITLDEHEIGGHPLPQATTPAPRWILHRCSPGTALLIEEHSGTMSLQER
jgi:hypothetical protein